MKTLISTVFLVLSFSAFAGRQKMIDWYVAHLEDSTMSATDTKITVHCYFTGGGMEQMPTQAIYSMNGSANATAELSKANEFTLIPKAGKYVFQVYTNSLYPEIATDSVEVKQGIGTHLYLYFRNEYNHRYQLEKPVIYLYPEITTDVSVKLKTIGELTFTYPSLNDSWSVTAQPDGTLISNGKTYPYLFWEADQHIQDPFETNTFEGFVVEGKDAVTFLEDKLTQIGFNDRERTDFITYWGPQLAQNDYNNITFEFNEACDAYGTLDISPKPEHINRVYMIWSKADGSALDGMITPQELPVLDRSGFDVLEWGGMQILNVEL